MTSSSSSRSTFLSFSESASFLARSLVLALVGASLSLGLQADELAPEAQETIEYQYAEAAQVVVNINQADAQKLADVLVGVGPARAQAIIDYREQHGPFTTLEQLMNVTGIGPATLERNRALLAL